MTPAAHKRMQVRFLCVFKDLCDHFEVKNSRTYRTQVTEWVLGLEKAKRSSNEFSGKDFAMLIDTMNTWIKGDQEPGPLTKSEQAQATHDQNKNQLIHVIEELADDDYIQAVCDDRHNKRPWRDLTAFQLSRLRMTIKRAALAAKKNGRSLKSTAIKPHLNSN